jgi:hypothetical protein
MDSLNVLQQRNTHKDETFSTSRNGGGVIEMGKGRDIPVKQGMLYKRSSKSLNKVRTNARAHHHLNHTHRNGKRSLCVCMPTADLSITTTPKTTWTM